MRPFSTGSGSSLRWPQQREREREREIRASWGPLAQRGTAGQHEALGDLEAINHYYYRVCSTIVLTILIVIVLVIVMV